MTTLDEARDNAHNQIMKGIELGLLNISAAIYAAMYIGESGYESAKAIDKASNSLDSIKKEISEIVQNK